MIGQTPTPLDGLEPLAAAASFDPMAEFAELERVKIERIGTVDQIARHLRVMISAGHLPQGQRLPEVALAGALGVSRNTFRDAIRVLVTEGLVVHELHRGAIVRTLSAADISDIYALRRMFESQGLAALSGAPLEARNRIKTILDSCQAALDEADYIGFIESELEFHGALVSFLGSERLDRFFGQLLVELRLLLGELSSDSEAGKSRRILSLYRRLVRVAEKGDHEAAAALLGAHLDVYEERLRAAIGQRHSDDEVRE
jgi:DNA-binding GntR family transcriptional regulator